MATSYNTRLNTRISPHLGKLSFKNLLNYSPNLMLWGGASAIGLFVFVEGWPLFQQTFFSKIPVVGKHWEHAKPEES
ncbi:cytochrome b-c1 complex subunit 10, mitochondrial [Monosporozyma unispora]